MKRIVIGLAAAAALYATPALAAEQVYSASPGLVGNQSNFFGTLGLNFTVNAPIKISQLGVFDSGSNGLSNDIFVTIFNSAGAQLFAPVKFVAGPNNNMGAYIFQPFDFVLGAGTYQLASWGYGGAEPDYNASGPGGSVSFNTLGGRLTALDASYTYTAGAKGNIADNGTTRYAGATLVAAAVPEASTWAMMLLGFGLMGFGLRYRSRKKISVTYA